MAAAPTIHDGERFKERRRWPRLPLAIPVFVRGLGARRNQPLEFTTIINVSNGGVLFASRHSFAQRSRVSLEIPVVLDGNNATYAQRKFQARILRTSHTAGHYWHAAQFKSPLRVSRSEES